MILSDGEIQKALKDGLIKVDPPPVEEQFDTTTLDLHLGDELVRLKTSQELGVGAPQGIEHLIIVDLSDFDVRGLVNRYSQAIPKEPDGSFLLEPHSFVLGATHEVVTLPRRSKIAARVEGRSSLARVGLVVHMTAPTIQAGFDGVIVLEMYNFSPYTLRLQPRKLRVCQLIFERVGKVPKQPIRTQHLGQRGVRRL